MRFRGALPVAPSATDESAGAPVRDHGWAARGHCAVGTLSGAAVGGGGDGHGNTDAGGSSTVRPGVPAGGGCCSPLGAE